MMEDAAMRQDALQLEALLVSREYLYTLFHKLLGGTPDAELLEVLLGDATADVVEEYAGDNATLRGLCAFLRELRAEDAAGLIDRARDEYARIFVGPAALPASPYESPYTGVHDMGVFQENTLAVRAWYRERGYQAKRLQAVPDDHVSMMCAFMTTQAAAALAAFREGRFTELAGCLRDQMAFAEAHLANWVGTFATSVRNSKAGASAVLYPQMLEALDAFASADVAFLTEAAYWVESHPDMPPTAPAPELAAAEEALAALVSIRPFGIQDNELVPVD